MAVQAVLPVAVADSQAAQAAAASAAAQAAAVAEDVPAAVAAEGAKACNHTANNTFYQNIIRLYGDENN